MAVVLAIFFIELFSVNNISGITVDEIRGQFCERWRYKYHVSSETVIYEICFRGNTVDGHPWNRLRGSPESPGTKYSLIKTRHKNNHRHVRHSLCLQSQNSHGLRPPVSQRPNPLSTAPACPQASHVTVIPSLSDSTLDSSALSSLEKVKPFSFKDKTLGAVKEYI